MATGTPAGHPPIDWTKWEPAGDGDGMISSQLPPLYELSLMENYIDTNQSAHPAQ